MIYEQFTHGVHSCILSIDQYQGSKVSVSINYDYDPPNLIPPDHITHIDWGMKLQRFYPK